MRTSAPILLRVWGPTACFTRPDLKVDRVSFDMITPSAARGILESILWKPEMRWVIQSIELLAPIRTQTLTINELKSRASGQNIMQVISPPEGDGLKRRDVQVCIDIGADRTQRTSTILRDVDYLIGACIEIRDGMPDVAVRKYDEMFRRRASKGQFYHSPCLGQKEHAADFRLVENRADAPSAIPVDRDLGLLPYAVHAENGAVSPSYIRGCLTQGRLEVPPPNSREVLR